MTGAWVRLKCWDANRTFEKSGMERVSRGGLVSGEALVEFMFCGACYRGAPL